MQVKVGLVGLGHLGQIHLKCLQEISELQLIGIFDIDHDKAEKLASSHSLKVFDSVPEMLEEVDAIDIVTPTSTHYEIASSAMSAGRHVFIEKPVTAEVRQAEALRKLQIIHDVVVQVGHVERFNPAMLAIKDLALDPRFIEVHRLSHFNPRGTDVSVVLDLMIHDLDIILAMIPSQISNIMASGVPLVSETPDIGNARIEWENGCVANITASRISLKSMRKMRLFQSNAYIGLDFLERSAQIIRLSDNASNDDPSLETFTLETTTGTKTIEIEIPESKPVNAIRLELEEFIRSIKQGIPPVVGLEAATNALTLAHQISELIDQNLKKQLS